MTDLDEKKTQWNSFRAKIFYVLVSFVICFSLMLNMLLHHQYGDHIDSLSNDLISQSNENVIDKTTDYLMPAVLLSETAARMATIGTLDLDNKSQLENLFLTILKPYPQLQAIYYGDEDGNFFMINRGKNNTTTKEVLHVGNDIKTTYKIRNDENVVIDEKTIMTEVYDARLRPWYKGAKEVGQRFWTDVYVFFTNKQSGITASYPMYSSDNRLKGVFGVDISLSNISSFLNAQKMSKKGHMFILNDKNKVVALPASLSEKKQSDHPLHIKDLGRPEILEAVSIRDTYKATKFTYTVDGKDYFASFLDFPQFFGKQWTTALIVPSQALNTNKVIMNRIFLIFLGLAVLIIYLISILLSRSIFDPLNAIIADMKKIGNLVFDDFLHIPQSVREINSLSDAYVSMKAALKKYKSTRQG